MLGWQPHRQGPYGYLAADSDKRVLTVGAILQAQAGCSIDSHTGLLNGRLICHLPPVVPAGYGLRVGDERRDVTRGEVWAFDESINQEEWNNSADDRIVLIFDVWHPDLTELERRDITSLLEAVSA